MGVDVRRRLEAKVGEPEPLPALSVVGLLTRDRVERVTRALASFHENARRHGRRPSLRGGGQLGGPLHAGRVPRGAGGDSRGRTRSRRRSSYVGLREREAFVGRLAALGIDPDAARFGVLDVTGLRIRGGREPERAPARRRGRAVPERGRRRRLRAGAVPCARAPGVELFAGGGDGYENYNPADFWFFADRAALERAVRSEDTDALGLARAPAGPRPGAACREAGRARPLALDRFAPSLLERVLARGGQVRVTLAGLFGDIGWYAPTWLLLLTGASRERFTGSEAAYLSACASRQALRVVPRPTITDGRYFQSTLLGLDNRVPLPPFMPVQRYEDGVFRIALRACFEDAYFAHLPWAAFHDGDEGRRWSREDIWRTAAWIRTGELMVHCVRSYCAAARRGCRGSLPLARRPPRVPGRDAGPPTSGHSSVPASSPQKSRYLEHLEALLRGARGRARVLGARPPSARDDGAGRAADRRVLRSPRPGGQPPGRGTRGAAPWRRRGAR